MAEGLVMSNHLYIVTMYGSYSYLLFIFQVWDQAGVAQEGLCDSIAIRMTVSEAVSILQNDKMTKCLKYYVKGQDKKRAMESKKIKSNQRNPSPHSYQWLEWYSSDTEVSYKACCNELKVYVKNNINIM